MKLKVLFTGFCVLVVFIFEREELIVKLIHVFCLILPDALVLLGLAVSPTVELFLDLVDYFLDFRVEFTRAVGVDILGLPVKFIDHLGLHLLELFLKDELTSKCLIVLVLKIVAFFQDRHIHGFDLLGDAYEVSRLVNHPLHGLEPE